MLTTWAVTMGKLLSFSVSHLNHWRENGIYVKEEFYED